MQLSLHLPRMANRDLINGRYRMPNRALTEGGLMQDLALTEEGLTQDRVLTEEGLMQDLAMTEDEGIKEL